MAPYRETPDASELPTFAQHISIAETLLGVNDDLRRQLVEQPDHELHRSYLQTWGDLWEQLDQARAIANRLARDVRAFDLARTRAGDPNLVVAGFVGITDDMRRSAVFAIDALRRCVPEVVVPSARRSASTKPVRPGLVASASPVFWFRIVFLTVVLLGILIRAMVMD